MQQKQTQKSNKRNNIAVPPPPTLDDENPERGMIENSDNEGQLDEDMENETENFRSPISTHISRSNLCHT